MQFSFRPLLRLGALALAIGATTVFGTRALAEPPGTHFDMIASPGIASCLPYAVGHVSIRSEGQVQRMRLDVQGLPPNTGFDFFVTELPHKPIGVSWYQSDLQTNRRGEGHVEVVGRFNAETFSFSNGGPTTTFAPTHMYHLGLWFDDPQVPLDLGCEPGQTQPSVTFFNGQQHAGIQVLNTANFPDNAGPLSRVH